MTPDLLQAATGCTSAAAAIYAKPLAEACDFYDINTLERRAAFLAQVAHESGGLRCVLELADGSAYEGRRDLGNVKPGDGSRYRGRGLIQCTGRANYREMAKQLLGRGAPDFEAKPAELERPEWAAWSAAAWWAIHGCNELADQGEYVGIGRLINRGNAASSRAANGEADRLARWERAKKALLELESRDSFSSSSNDADPSSSESGTSRSGDSSSSADTIPPGEAPDWTPPPVKDKPMAPFIIPAVIELAKLIPKLGGMFGGSEVAQRNVAAAGVVVDAVTAAVGAANAQEAVEKIAADPAAREAANKAVEGVWYQITEAGGGGVDGARKADAAAQTGGDIKRSPSFWIGLLLLPLVYLLVLSLIGLIGTATWSDDVRAGLAGSLISAIVGGLVGYYFGQTTSRNRAPAP